MAISLCDALIEKGISVPEDILVTGYDGYTETRMHVPAITTYQTSQEMLGRKAVCLLCEAITGNKPSLSKNEKGLMLCRESCGCNSNFLLTGCSCVYAMTGILLYRPTMAESTELSAILIRCI